MKQGQENRSPWRIASRSLIAAAALCIAAAALAAGAAWLARNGALEQGQAQADLQAAELALQNTQSDRARLEGNLQLFGKLRQARFVQAPDRLLLLEALEAAAGDLRQSPLTWELGAQETLKPLNDDKTGEAVAQLVRVPMKLGASGVHEQEWLALLARLQGSGAGSFTADDCVYSQKVFARGARSTPAVDVVCNLSWLYVLPDAKANAPAAGVEPKSP
ncbi:MAG: hypothetical protein PHR71_00035 [Polaromonas sp.]|nr:hypothetical protein [Polaromonas sp.]